MRRFMRGVLAAALLSTAACSDFLTGGELTEDPNRPVTATNNQLFLGIQTNVYATHTQKLPRISALLTQQINATNSAYIAHYQYVISEDDASGLRQIYGAGGLKDIRTLQARLVALNDSLFLGITQVQEALLVSMAADVWGDITYSAALSGEPNPPLDGQLDVFDALQALLDRAIVNLGATGPTNFGPGTLDASYQGNAARWRRLAYTLKARMYMHNAEVRATAATYNAAIAAARNGILATADDFKAVFTGATGSQNPWAQVTAVRGITPDPAFDALLVSRNDPRRTQYYAVTGDRATALSAARLATTFAQPIATAAETHLIWAEAAYRAGDEATALSHLNTARGLAGLGPVTATGTALLEEILTEEFINSFQLGVEAWKLYRRTCFPNLVNTSPTNQPMPGRLYYEQAERIANNSMPSPGTGVNGLRNANDLVNAAPEVGGGASCQAGA